MLHDGAKGCGVRGASLAAVEGEFLQGMGKHYGYTGTSRVEGMHATLKRYLQVSTGDLKSVKDKISLAVENQRCEILTALSAEQMQIPYMFRVKLYDELVRKVSMHALRKSEDQCVMAESGEDVE
ncbi:hypothetical protein PsorP6_006380 [Peronosclerospora sorghi]|uniref:Uncharacterized protein n=1 Tax=Peronosclerospora sorghi TaxID=230839 RepID=A0ACC0W6J1_9STRA|nr:hypothetical protein PsorP6_006380 [Peronosclerospora sorghi]